LKEGLAIQQFDKGLASQISRKFFIFLIGRRWFIFNNDDDDDDDDQTGTSWYFREKSWLKVRWLGKKILSFSLRKFLCNLNYF